MSNRKLTLIAFIIFDFVLVAVFMGAGILRNASNNNPENELSELGLALIPDRPALVQFQLRDHEGRSFSNQDLMGNWNLLFFGFTSCPDVCPLTMNALKLFYGDLENTDLAKDTKVIMVSVDPDRDSVEAMASYVENYHSDFIGLTGDSAVIASLASELYIAFTEPEAHDQHEDNDYIIKHSGYIAIVGPDGVYRAVVRAPHSKDSLTEAYAAVRNN